MRRVLVLVSLVGLVVAGCSSSSKSVGTNTTIATLATPPTSPAGVLTPNNLPGTFHLSVYIVSVDLTGHTITVDPMAFLTGAAATAAFKQDHPGAGEDAPPNDYYIKNTTKDHDQLPLAANTVVKLVHVGGTDHTQPLKVALASLPGYPSLTSRPFQISGENGTVTGVTETFVP